MTMTFAVASSRRRSGFTLVELLAVTAIIAIVAGIVLGISGFATKKSDRAKAIADIEKIKNGLEEYRLQFGRYPTPSQNVWDVDFSNAVGPFISGGYRATDPWGRSYVYVPSASALNYRLYSAGPSGSSTADDVDSASGQL